MLYLYIRAVVQKGFQYIDNFQKVFYLYKTSKKQSGEGLIFNNNSRRLSKRILKL